MDSGVERTVGHCLLVLCCALTARRTFSVRVLYLLAAVSAYCSMVGQWCIGT
jgi:hypothetical protein